MISSAVPVWKMLVGPLTAFAVCYYATPPVKRFAENVGAIDLPKDERRVNKYPIPRMGGLAIFAGFVISVLLFVDMSMQVMGLLLGAVIIATMGALDDILNLNPWLKFAGQILAALVAIRCGIIFDVISNPGFLEGEATISIGWLAYPATVLWIVACTNAVNLIDGLDGLAVGVSAISSLSMMVVSLIVPVATGSVPLILACLVGACVGFMPYNMNPAKIFMGDVGSQFLGFVLSCVSIMGLFKFHAIITFLVPFLAMAVPLGDTFFAFFRRILHGQSPFHPDRGHIHHRLLALGMNQKQAVAILYWLSAILGFLAVLIAGPGTGIRIVCLILAFALSLAVWLFVFPRASLAHHAEAAEEPGDSGQPDASSSTESGDSGK